MTDGVSQAVDRTALVDQLVTLMQSGGAHPPILDCARGTDPAKQGSRPDGVPYSPWELLKHMQIAARDIVRFSQGPGGEELSWPDGYWPADPAPPTPDAWEATIAEIEADFDAMETLLRDPARSLSEPFAWGDGQTLLREALLIADHNAWHAGQLVLVRRLLNDWETWLPPTQA